MNPPEPSARVRPVPYYAQTAGFSCGAASLVMVLNALRDLPLSRGAEFEVWREATMVGIPGIDAWGLAVPALKRDVPVTVVASGERTFPKFGESAREIFSEEEIDLAVFNQTENRGRAQAAGVTWEQREPAPADVEAALDAGRLPILLVDLGRLGGDQVPHWVVVVSRENDAWTLHDPDPDGPGTRVVTQKEAWHAADPSEWASPRTVVLFGP